MCRRSSEMTCGLRPCMHTSHARGLWYDLRTHSSEEGPRTEAQSSTARSSTAQRRGSAGLRNERGMPGRLCTKPLLVREIKKASARK